MVPKFLVPRLFLWKNGGATYEKLFLQGAEFARCRVCRCRDLTLKLSLINNLSILLIYTLKWCRISPSKQKLLFNLLTSTKCYFKDHTYGGISPAWRITTCHSQRSTCVLLSLSVHPTGSLIGVPDKMRWNLSNSITRLCHHFLTIY